MEDSRYAHSSIRILRGRFERLVDTGLRLNELRGERELHQFLMDTDHDLRIAGSMMPGGEESADLLNAVEGWLVETRRTQSASLRHGPDGAAAIDQRSCVVAPLITGDKLLGHLYADVEGPSGRFDASDCGLLAMLAEQGPIDFGASIGLDNSPR